MAISLTPSAADRVAAFLADARARAGACGSASARPGCSGFAYVINYADEARAG